MTYIKTFFPAVLPTLFAFNQFSCLDIVALRAGISWKCGKFIKPAARQGIAPWAQTATDFLYRWGPEFARKALWYWFVAEQATEFLARWTSLMHTTEGCDLPPAGVAQAEIIWNPFGVLPGHATHGAVGLSTEGTPCGQNFGGLVRIFAGCQATIMVTWQYKPLIEGQAKEKVQTTMTDQDGNDIPVSSGNNGDDAANGQAFGIAHNVAGGLVSSTDVSIYVTNTGSADQLAQPTSWCVAFFSGYRSEVLPAGCIPKQAKLPGS
jgi:hypothetical protein